MVPRKARKMDTVLKLVSGIILVCFPNYGLSASSTTDKHNMATLLQTQYNRYLLENVPRPYEIIFPKRIVRRNKAIGISTKEHQIKHHGTYEHYKHVTYELMIQSKLQKIRLERNEILLSSGVQVRHFIEENQQIVSQTVEHCFYHGYVRKDQWSSVAVSTCHGIRGVINLNNETYVIQPLLGGDEGTEHPHIVFKATPSESETCGNEHGQWLPFQELHKGEFIKRVKLLKAKQQSSQQNENGDRVVTDKMMKLALIMDHTTCNQLNFSFAEMVTYTIQIANMVDLYYKEIGMRTPIVYLEHWNQEDKITISPNLRKNLEQILLYKGRELTQVEHDAAHLLIGEDLEDNSIGMAIPDSVCTKRAVGISKMKNVFQPQQVATVLSHMIGHTLGIKHDEDGGCDCEDDLGCIMSTSVLSKTSVSSRQFSSCSLSDLDVALNMDIAYCLSPDNQKETFSQTCGNMYIERGEECDCGGPEECDKIDPCCDPSTCLLKTWAQCRTGACCHNCTFMAKNYVCRERSTECDVPELCSGKSGECSANNYVQDGHPCGNGQGYCVGGICPTLTQQCQHIWGPDALGADYQCFERFNPTGNFNGHCGKNNRTGSFAKCLPENIQCGLLHCQGGTTVPLLGSDRSFSKTTFRFDDVEYDCKVIHGPAVIGLPHFGLVQDGTKCGNGGICMNKQCVSTSVLPPLTCPGTVGDIICSGHGVCTRDSSCFCDEGWDGSDCSIKVNITVTTGVMATTAPPIATTSTTTPAIFVIPIEIHEATTVNMESSVAALVPEDNGFSSVWLIIILASVVGGLVFMLTMTFVCYRRRNPVKLFNKKKGFFGKKGNKDDKCVEAGNKLISFGNLPSYKSDKMWGKKKKKKGRLTSEEESDIGELPPPPIIISNDAVKPERGILKHCGKAEERRSSESNTGGSDVTCDRESMDRYMYDEDDDDEAEEIQEILSRKFDTGNSMEEALDQIAESSSFDFVLPMPHFNSGNSGNSGNMHSSPRKMMMGVSGYDFPVHQNQVQRPPMLWKSNLSSPPKSKVIRMKNLDELIQQIDRHTIDLSPSPDELPMQVSPSTSEDVRSSSTEDRDRHYFNNCHTPQSPQSITSGSTRDTYRPLLSSQWTKYILRRNEWDNESADLCTNESPPPHINIPPPMSPLHIRNIFNYAQKTLERDNNDTPMGSQTGECSSNNGTTNSRCGYEKSSGYGSEHDPAEENSIDDMSHTQSRSGSASPPSYSAVIRTGPNQIKLVPAKKLQETGIENEDLHRLLQELPRIDAGTFERSPVPANIKQPRYGFLTKADSLPPGIPPPSDSFPEPCPLGKQDHLQFGSAPCIDCSLESIPQAVLAKSKPKHKNSFNISDRPNSFTSPQKEIELMFEQNDSDTDSRRHSALDHALEALPMDPALV
ncbi:disintegrin and metalloproteinase domain-containing protein unc-71-like isoform X2 [Argopecten irradians]|uniref:disintegrin and metalloproteinase domain-containing protein unc-71-like isoform X2 n=1 Tax=Argopecten irradians TaxID=31199 RepID=UPI00371B9DCC